MIGLISRWTRDIESQSIHSQSLQYDKRKLIKTDVLHKTNHKDVITWRRFLHYWPFVRGTHKWLAFPPSRLVCNAKLSRFIINVFLSETPWCSCGVTVIEIFIQSQYNPGDEQQNNGFDIQ